jgi:hypothetical protein
VGIIKKTTAGPAQIARESSAVDDWFADHINLAGALVLLAGFLTRLWTAWGTFLNPDEALHFRIANQGALDLVYRASLTESHPPLLYWILHVVRYFGTSEILLRLPSVIAGAIFCWLLFQWLTRAIGPLPGFVGLLLASLLPPVVRLSAEVRQYALLLMFLAGALYFLECALEDGSAWYMAVSAASLYLGMLSHYSGLFFAVALGAYGLLKISGRFGERPSRPVISIWLGAQIGTLALALFLYKSHLSHLGHGESRMVLQGWMSEFYLRRSYFESGRDNPLLFVIGHTFGVFQFIFGQLAVGDVAGLLFVLGAWRLWRQPDHREKNIGGGRLVAVFLALLFALACGASLAHIYPYGGTRHSSFLIIPAIAGVSVCCAWLAQSNWARGVTFAIVVIAICTIFGRPHQPYIARADQKRERMTAAMDFLRSSVAPGELIFTDYESSMILGHYLCRQQPIRTESAGSQFETFTCEGHRVVTANRTTATNFTPDVFLSLGQSLFSTFNAKGGDRVWVFQAGWGVDLPERLRESSRFHNLPFQSFGNNIKILKLTAAESGRAIL